MIELSLLDVMLASAPDLGRSQEILKEFIRSCVAHIEEIDRLDEIVIPTHRPIFNRPMAELIRGLHENWARYAEGLMERIRPMPAVVKSAVGYEAFRDVYGRTRAMLSVSVDDMEAAELDLVEGRVIPIAEVRSMFGLPKKNSR
jgi:hypothetical protein